MSGTMSATTNEEDREMANFVGLTLSEQIEFEHGCLTCGREFLPPCALAVLDGESTPEYLAWLQDALDVAEREGAIETEIGGPNGQH